MPIYEYHCEGCGERVEVFQRSVTSAAAPVCPRCGSGALTRLVSRFAVHRGDDVYANSGEERYLDQLEGGDPGMMSQFAGGMGGGGMGDLGGDFGGGDEDDFDAGGFDGL